jgi:DDE superfamily endonuclease/helix-turn-helix, Psq domain
MAVVTAHSSPLLIYQLVVFCSMVNKYRRKTDRQNWREEDMQNAIDAVQREEMGWLLASKEFNVPQATLRRRARNKNKYVNATAKGLGRFRPSLDTDMERDLVQHLLEMESRLFGMNCIELRKLAFDIAQSNGTDNNFNVQKRIAGKDWLKGFRTRHPEISIRKPEPTSLARAQAFNKPQVTKFFEILDSTMKMHNINPLRVYNMDESGLNTVQATQRIVALKGKKQVGAITSAERGVHCTVVCCMCAAGTFIPPCIIFPRKRWKPELADNGPPGTLNLCQENGWMTSDLFLQWLQHFAAYTAPSPGNKVLLLLDGHSSHKSYEAVKYARENGIVLMCFPPHCTHRLQPLDVVFFGPLKTYFNQETTKWMKIHPGRAVTQFQISGLLNAAYGKAATVGIATSGFHQTGIVPFNPDIFPDHLYAPADVTDQPEAVEQVNSM